MEPQERWVQPARDASLRLHVLEWPGDGRPFVLLHGLASNATTWAAVARVIKEGKVRTYDMGGKASTMKAVI